MREILFRGQTRRKGEKVYMSGAPVPSNWVYGGVAQSVPDRDFSIIYQIEPEIKKYPVYADTVSQYTGIDDNNGNKIFEGDIVDILTENEEIGVVECFNGAFIVKADGFCLDFLNNINGTDVSVVGNIQDNPELLKGNE